MDKIEVNDKSEIAKDISEKEVEEEILKMKSTKRMREKEKNQDYIKENIKEQLARTSAIGIFSQIIKLTSTIARIDHLTLPPPPKKKRRRKK